MRLCDGEQLFFGEALHHHFRFPPSLDASAQVLLLCGLGGKQFATQLATVGLGVIPVSPGSRNLTLGETSI
jgi:hypothetical protein